MAVKQQPYDVGDEVVLFASYVAADGVTPVTPDEVVLQIGRRDGHVLHTFRLTEDELTVAAAGTVERSYVIEEPDLRFTFDAVGGVTIADTNGQIPTRKRVLARPA